MTKLATKAKCPHGLPWFARHCFSCEDALHERLGHYTAITLRGALREALLHPLRCKWVETPYGPTLPLTLISYDYARVDDYLKNFLGCPDEPLREAV